MLLGLTLLTLVGGLLQGLLGGVLAGVSGISLGSALGGLSGLHHIASHAHLLSHIK